MKVCPSCRSESPADGRFCQQCGRPFPPADATVNMSATQFLRGPRQQSFDVKALFGTRPRLVVGRAADCDIPLQHPSVSRYHARIERRGDRTYVTDLSSVNGVWVGGKRIAEPTRILDGDKVGIGPYLLTIDAGDLYTVDSSRGFRLEARGLEKIVPVPGGVRKILDDINLCVNPGEFVALLGPSGCGKSTLMDALNGRRRATGGRVLANGEDFYRHYDSFRQSLGYVPQKDIVHTQLSVLRALLYTARLRLPPDTAPTELRTRLEEVIRRMELGPHQHTPVGALSGGQIKRVSLGAELLAEPALLFIDEATSGLDAGTERRMMHLFRELADDGRSLVCITHNVDNVDQCHLVLILAKGQLIFCGPPKEVPRWFGVARISDVYDRIAQRELADWRREFLASDLHKEFVANRLADPLGGLTSPRSPEPTPLIEPPPDTDSILNLSALSGKLFPPLAERFRQLEAGMLRLREWLHPIEDSWHQFRVLTARYVELTVNDPRSLRLVLLQAPLVALFLLLGFVGKPFHRPMPLLRPLDDDERRTLLVLRGLAELTDGKKEMTAEQKEALRQVRLSVAGVDATVDGSGLVGLLRALQGDKLTAAQKATLKETRLTLDADGMPLTVSVAEASQAWRRFQQSDIPAKLLSVPGPVVPTEGWYDPRFAYILLFILAVVVLWFGCNNASREIVKEEAILARERAVNLRLLPYLASKFVVLGVITTFQVGVLMALVYGPLEYLARNVEGHSVPPAELTASYGVQFVTFALLGLAGVALGLVISASVTTPERANALLPYAIIPQMILGGGFMQVTGWLWWLAAFLAPVYWAYMAVHLGGSVLPAGFPGHRDEADGALMPCLALAAQGAVLLAVTYAVLRRR